MKACLHYLAVAGVDAWRQNSGAVMGEYKGKKRFVRFSGRRGVSDIIGFLPDGRFLAIECKAPGGHAKATAEQLMFVDAVRAAGGFAMVATSVDELHAAIAPVIRAAIETKAARGEEVAGAWSWT